MHVVFIRSSRSRFCSSVSVLHVENSFCCSSVIGDSPSSVKNCANVIPNALHTASKVGMSEHYSMNIVEAFNNNSSSEVSEIDRRLGELQ